MAYIAKFLKLFVLCRLTLSWKIILSTMFTSTFLLFGKS